MVAAATRRRGRRRIYGRVLPQMVKRRVNRRTLGDSFERERTLDVIVYELWDLTGVEMMQSNSSIWATRLRPSVLLYQLKVGELHARRGGVVKIGKAERLNGEDWGSLSRKRYGNVENVDDGRE
jgi:hypothetical protein